MMDNLKLLHRFVPESSLMKACSPNKPIIQLQPLANIHSFHKHMGMNKHNITFLSLVIIIKNTHFLF